MSIMMVLDYLNEALKKKGESSDNNGSFLYYEDVLKKLSTEVKSWTFISKGNAKYEFEDCDSAVFFLSYVWNLIQLYGTDLDFWVVCWNNEVMGNGSIWFQQRTGYHTIGTPEQLLQIVPLNIICSSTF